MHSMSCVMTCSRRRLLRVWVSSAVWRDLPRPHSSRQQQGLQQQEADHGRLAPAPAVSVVAAAALGSRSAALGHCC